MSGSGSQEQEAGHEPFKICPACGHVWETRDGFLRDGNLELVEYQVNFKKLEAGIFRFTHSCGCGGSLTATVGDFADLYDGSVHPDRALGTYQCPDHCRHGNELEPCTAACECAYVREIMQIFR